MLYNRLRRERRRRAKKRGQDVQGCRYETPCSPSKRRVGGRGKKGLKDPEGAIHFFFLTAVVENSVIVTIANSQLGTTPFSTIAPESVCVLCSEWPF